MSKGIIQTVAGAAEIAAGVAVAILSGGGGAWLAAALIASGAGMTMSGIGTMLTPGAMKGFATTVRNPTAPWDYVYGRVRTGGAVIKTASWPADGHGGAD